MTDKQYREIISSQRIIVGMMFIGYGATQDVPFSLWLGFFLVGLQIVLDCLGWYADRQEKKLAELRND